MIKTKELPKEVTVNSCNLCSPLGASIAFKGIKNCMAILHGSQGCATYIRRYMIAHFREPVDIASSSFTEDTAVFGGGEKLKNGIDNIISQYNPEVIGIATSCLSETIGDDVSRYIQEYQKERTAMNLPEIILTSTPSYNGNHETGFFKTQRALVEHLCSQQEKTEQFTAFINIISPEDIRQLKEIFQSFNYSYILMPDFSDTLDGGSWKEFNKIPPGGTSVDEISRVSSSKTNIEFSICINSKISPGDYLFERFNIPNIQLPIPIGIKATDQLMTALEEITNTTIPINLENQRRRLIDAYSDAHKYIFGKKVAIIGHGDLVYSLASFISEVGMIPLICSTGGTHEKLIPLLTQIAEEYHYPVPQICLDYDHDDIESELEGNDIDLIIGSSKAYKMAKKLKKPLIRIGFPIHDRFGAAAKLTIGYQGTRSLLNEIVNLFIQIQQDENPVGYTYQ
ncbi:MAG: nitrogenase [Spirochaetales bacterium]|nr:nitrogenase [Spirochaetales bacterium]